MLVEAWAKNDANGALAWCESNLAGSALARAVGGVVSGAAQSDIAGAAALVAGMSPSPARAEAAEAVAKKWLPGLASGKPLVPETLAWLDGLDPDSVRRVLNQVQWSWATSDPKSMAAFLAESKSVQVPGSADTILARELARSNRTEALAWANRLPESRGLSAGADAFSQWRLSQPEDAMKWLNGLPPSDPRRDLYFQSAIQSLVYEP